MKIKVRVVKTILLVFLGSIHSAIFAWNLSSFNLLKMEQSSERLTNQLLALQKKDGQWDGVFEGDVSVDSLVIILGRALKLDSPDMEQKALKRIFSASTYRPDGLWSAYPGGPADLTITATTAMALELLPSMKTDPRLILAQDWVQKEGGWTQVHPLTGAFLALARITPAGDWAYLTPKFLALPDRSPISFSNIGIARSAVGPISVWSFYNGKTALNRPVQQLSSERIHSAGSKIGHPFSSTLLPLWDIFDLGTPHFSNIQSFGLWVDSIIPGDPEFWAQEGLGWILGTQQSDGTWGGTLQTSFIALLTLDQARKAGVEGLDAAIVKGWEGLLTWRREWPGLETFQQFSEGPVMETARILNGLYHRRELLPVEVESKAVQWLLNHQINAPGEWSRRLPHVQPGGWAYQYANTTYPDVDDTAMVLETLSKSTLKILPEVQSALQRGFAWMMAMQNANGGFPVWEHETPAWLQSFFSLFQGMDVLVDPAQVDVSSRAVRALHAWLNILPEGQNVNLEGTIQNSIDRACSFLVQKSQTIRTKSGESKIWYGDWAVNYLYGTSETLAGLLESECWDASTAFQTARWLLEVQNSDGGWGEDPASYQQKRFIPHRSTLSQTAFVLNGLLALSERSQYSLAPSYNKQLDESLEKGLGYLIRKSEESASKPWLEEREFMQVVFKGKLFGRYILLPHYETAKVLSRAVHLNKISKMTQ